MNEPLDFIPSKASLNKTKTNYESVEFKSYRSNSVKQKAKAEETKSRNEVKEFNMRQTKHEVIKLGMSGMDSHQKEEAKVNLLIKLGAKPPKKKYKNYKQLQIEKKSLKEEEFKVVNFSQLGKNQLGKSTAKGKSYDRKRRKENNILSIYGKVVAKSS